MNDLAFARALLVLVLMLGSGASASAQDIGEPPPAPEPLESPVEPPAPEASQPEVPAPSSDASPALAPASAPWPILLPIPLPAPAAVSASTPDEDGQSFFPIRDPVLVFAIVLVLILFAPMIMAKFRLPGMIALLVAGAILGPNALGVLQRDQSFVLFGTVGLLYIMFSAALEIDLQVFKRSRSQSIVFGLLTFSIPMTIGVPIGRLLGLDWPAAILLASLFASHTLLAYPIVSRLGLTKSAAVTATLGGTILTDTLALLVLAVIASMSRGEMNEAFWYKLVVLLSLYVGGILFGLPKLGRWFFRHISRDGVTEFVFVLAVVFLCAALSHVAGVEPIVGAFLAGLALNRLIPPSSALMSRIHFTGEAIFVPFFLLSVGMLLDVRIFAGGLRSWAVAISMIAAVTLAKWLAAEAMRRLYHMKVEEGRLMFGLSVAQAAATLAAVMVGYEIGLFDDAIINGTILMILTTCILAPWLVDRNGRILARDLDAEPETDGRPQRILVGLSNPAYAQPLLELATLVRDKSQGQPVFPVNVIEERDGDVVEAVAKSERTLSRMVQYLTEADVPASPLTRVDLGVPAGLLRAARELRGSDLIVGWNGKVSAQELFFGSFLEKLLQEPHHTLLVARLVEPLKIARRVVLALPPDADLDRAFPGAIRTVKLLARNLGTPIEVMVETEQVARVKARVGQVKPSVEVVFRDLDSWSSLTQALQDNLREGDLVIVYAQREEDLGWRILPGQSGLPARLAKRFPACNLLIMYPALARSDAEEAGRQDRASLDSWGPEAPVTTIEDRSVPTEVPSERAGLN